MLLGEAISMRSSKNTPKSCLLLKSLNALSGKVNEVVVMLLMKIKDGLEWHSENKPDN